MKPSFQSLFFNGSPLHRKQTSFTVLLLTYLRTSLEMDRTLIIATRNQGLNLEFEMSFLRIVKSPTNHCKDLLTTIESQPSTRFRRRVEKTNKSELRNPLTYRGLIYIFEAGKKTFRLSCQFLRPKSPPKIDS